MASSKSGPSSSVTSSSRTMLSRGSIHTPLTPASVQDLKAKFDPGKTSGSVAPASTTTAAPRNSKIKTFGPDSEKKGPGGSSPNKDASTFSIRSSASINLSSVNSSLQAAAQRKLDAGSSTISSISSSNLQQSTSKLSVATSRPFSPSSLSSSKSGSPSSSGRNSPALDNVSKVTTSLSISSTANKWEPKSMTKLALNTETTSRTGSVSLSPSELKNSFERNKEGSLELPIMQISTTGSEVKVELKPKVTTVDTKLNSISKKKTDIGSSYLSKKVTDTKKDTYSSSVVKHAFRTEKTLLKENSPPIQRSSKLVAREIKIERLDSGISVTSYKDNDVAASTNSASKPTATAAVENKTRETKAGKVNAGLSSSSSSSKTDIVKPQPEFAQVKLRKARSEQSEVVVKLPPGRGNLKVDSSDVDEKRISCKINSERFERLMFDFQRGVPTETVPRRGSETDHIALQQKARELTKPAVEEDVPIIVKKKKEQSIFTEGLKVSDFVKQVNKLNPEMEAQPKWRVQRAISQTSSAASSDVGGDNFYQGIPGEDAENISDEDDDIYEKVTHRATSLPDGESGGEFTKTTGRRLGVYSQMKSLKNYAFKKLKQRGSKKKKAASLHQRNSRLTARRERQSDGGGCDSGEWSSSGTDYEDVSPEANQLPSEEGACLYEDLENFTKPSTESVKNKTITHKLKKMFHKTGSKSKKNKAFIDLGASAGTESEADTVDGTEDGDSDLAEVFSRTSGERNSGHITRDSAVVGSVSSITSTTEETASSSGNQSQVTSSTFQAPRLPPRTTKTLNQPLENSPPLPPRNPSLANKATLGTSQEPVVPVSPTNKISVQTVNKTKDRLSSKGNSQESCDTDDGAAATIEHIDQDLSATAAFQLEKLERSDSTSKKRRSLFGRKTGSGSSLSVTTTTTSAPASAYIYSDISAFPELKGDDATLYVDLEDEQIYGKASQFYISKFESEPLYQWYSKDKVNQNMCSDKSTSDDLSSDDDYLEDRKRPESLYEDVEKLLEKANSNITIATATTTAADNSKTSTSKLTVNLDQISTKDNPQRQSVINDAFKNGGSLHRALWCEMPQVIDSGILSKLTDQEKKIQEAMFEIITSEASYLKSLKILISVFLMAPEFSAEVSDKCVISRRDKQILFSNIGHIKDISEEFLKDLEGRWQESYYMKDICDIIYKHASQKFEPYVRYCGNQAFQDRILNILRLNTDFVDAVKRLEQNPDCQFLPLCSFLLLPMQRITRLPLLVNAIYHRLEADSSAHTSAQKAMDSIRKVAKRCDEAAKKMQQTEQICMLKSNLEFKVKEFPIISASRFLVKQGELTQIKVEGAGRKPLSKLLGSHKEHVYLFLFNDILLVAKKKGTNFQVRDYCQRNALHVETIDNTDKTHHIAPSAAAGIPNILFLAMLANHDNKQVEMVLSCKSESERTRWIDAIMPTHASTEAERIYDFWDYPQFHCVRKYIALQPDELNLEESDVINVTRKMADGWYEGERIRDGEKGWFPASHTEEINNSHVRARNLRLRYRLMRASEEYSLMELHKKY